MKSNVVHYQSKIQQLFEKFLEPDYQIKNDVYLNRLLTHLSGEEKQEVENAILALPLFLDWVVQAVTVWDSDNITPATNIASFTLNLTTLLSKDEHKFCYLRDSNVYPKLFCTVRAREPEISPSIKLGYIKLLSAALNHESGIQWTIENEFWEDVLQFSLTNQTVYITKEGHKYMTKVLEQTIDFDENFCNNIVGKIMMPLSEHPVRAIKYSDDLMEFCDEIVYKNLSPTLQLVGNIFEYFLGTAFSAKNVKIVLFFLKDYHLEKRICNYMMVAQNKFLVFDLGKIIFMMQYLELYIHMATGTLSLDGIQTLVRKIVSLFNTNISRGNFENVMKFCYFGQFYWKLVGSRIPSLKVTKDNEPVTFASQLLVLQLLPIFAVAMRYCKSDQEVDQDDFRDNYVQKLFEMMCENTVRIAYGWRTFLLPQSNLFEIATKALSYIMKSRKYYTRERAAMVFQALVYALKDYMRVIKDAPEKAYFFAKEVNFLSLLFDAFITFIEEFKLTWKDSVETICVMSLCYDFLLVPTWDTKLIIKALKLVNVAFSEYMSPNLALLVDTSTDSTLLLMGSLLHTKLHDYTWEVRDSATEVVGIIAHLANTKFPSLQKVLMDSDLPNLVVQMSTSDGESFVRATAIKCLQEMIQVEDIWNNVLKSQDLPQKMRHILLNETEGIVRVEAATFMCKAYEHQHFPEEIIDRVYDTMIHSSTADLHWEVKVRALGFWDQVITSYLQNQGMIDGSFPSVTFSKEHRKIVTLTDSEIKKRLQKVIHQLSNIGCLGVLISAIKDDCDMEVSKTAVNITQKLVELLKKYNIRADSSILTSPLPTEYGASSSASVSSGISADESMGSPVGPHPDFNDEIIDQIVNSKDINLLKNVYASSDYGSVLNYDIQVRKIVNPNEFLQFIQQDLNLVITEKKNWLNGIEDLGSLLDDMLKTYDDDINNMDCY